MYFFFVLYNLCMDLLHDIPTIPKRVQIPREAINSLSSRIIEEFHPQKIILFGSYAYGQPLPESDVDLLVVMSTDLSEVEQAVQISRKIPYRFGLDLIVCTPENLQQRLEWGDSFLKEIVERGIILYESTYP